MEIWRDTRTVVVKVPVVKERVTDVLLHLGVLSVNEGREERSNSAVYESA